MNADEKMKVIHRLLELYGQLAGQNFVAMVEQKQPTIADIVSDAMKVANQIEDAGIAVFDYTSDVAFLESLQRFTDISHAKI